jgi:hypothetical protein
MRVAPGRRAWRNVLLSGVVLLLAACVSSGSTSGGHASAGSPSPRAAAPPASASAALCEDVAALRGSLQKLASIRPSEGTVNELTAALQDVHSKLFRLSSSAGPLWTGQIHNLRSAVTKLQSAVRTLAAERNASSVSGVVAATRDVSAATHQLLAVASPSCPPPAASPVSSA